MRFDHTRIDAEDVAQVVASLHERIAVPKRENETLKPVPLARDSERSATLRARSHNCVWKPRNQSSIPSYHNRVRTVLYGSGR